MSRILRISPITYYERHLLKRLREDHPGFDTFSYEKKLAATQDFGALYANGFSREMRVLGYEAADVIFDFEDLQRTWAREHEVSLDEENWRTEILLAQMESFKPEILYIQGSHPFSSAKTPDLKDKFNFLKKIVVFSGFPEGAFDHFPGLDMIFAATPSIRDFYHERHPKVQLVYHGLDVATVEKLPKNQVKNREFSFLGSSGFGQSGKIERYWFLLELLEKSDIEMWLYEREMNYGVSPAVSLVEKTLDLVRQRITKKIPEMSPEELDFHLRMIDSDESFAAIHLRTHLKRQIQFREIRGKTYAEKRELTPPLPLGDIYPERCRAPLFGMDMLKVMSESKILFNMHTEAVDNEVGNMRLFDATGAGACLLTDTGSNIRDLFEPDKEIVTYSSLDECLEKVKFLSEHEDEAAKIAEAGKARVLRDHSVGERCRQIDQYLQDL